MTVRLTPRALAEVKRVRGWWRVHRPASPDLFERELAATLERIAMLPALGLSYPRAELRIPVRRLLMPRTLHHVYYVVEGSDITVLSVWGATQSTEPSL